VKKIFLLSLIVGFGIMATGCEKKKTTDEQLKENTAKEAELLKKSVSEKADKVENALKKGMDELKK
jgi:replicative DNA helicase